MPGSRKPCGAAYVKQTEAAYAEQVRARAEKSQADYPPSGRWVGARRIGYH